MFPFVVSCSIITGSICGVASPPAMVGLANIIEKIVAYKIFFMFYSIQGRNIIIHHMCDIFKIGKSEMGVDRTDFIVWGVKLPYDEWKTLDTDDQTKDKITDGLMGFDAIIDGMNGKYIVIGKIIKTSDDYTGFDFFVFENVSFPDILPSINIFFPNLDLMDFKLMIFSHFS